MDMPLIIGECLWLPESLKFVKRPCGMLKKIRYTNWVLGKKWWQPWKRSQNIIIMTLFFPGLGVCFFCCFFFCQKLRKAVVWDTEQQSARVCLFCQSIERGSLFFQLGWFSRRPVLTLEFHRQAGCARGKGGSWRGFQNISEGCVSTPVTMANKRFLGIPY